MRLPCFYAHLNAVEGALTKVQDEILFMAWESGAITGLDHGVGHFRPLKIIGGVPNAYFLSALGSPVEDRGDWGGRCPDQGPITPVTSYTGLTVLGEIGLADTQALHDVMFRGGYAAICTSRAN